MHPEHLYTLTPTQLWIRVLNNVLLATAFIMIAYVALYVLRNRDSGHRTLVKIGGSFFLMGFVHYTWSCFALLAHVYEISAALSTVCMILGCIFAGYLFSSRRDILYTLTTSEGQDRLFKDNLADLRTITSGLVVRAETTEQKAVAVQRRYHNETSQQVG